MVRKFYDIVFDEKCAAFGKKLGYEKVVVDKDLKIARGGSLNTNRKAVRNKANDILLDPITAKTKEFDTAVAQIAHDNDVVIGISLDSILKTRGLNRVRMIRNLRFMIQICQKKKADLILISSAHDKYGMRAPQDLASVGILLGLTKPQAFWAISEVPEAILEKVIS